MCHILTHTTVSVLGMCHILTHTTVSVLGMCHILTHTTVSVLGMCHILTHTTVSVLGMCHILTHTTVSVLGMCHILTHTTVSVLGMCHILTHLILQFLHAVEKPFACQRDDLTVHQLLVHEGRVSEGLRILPHHLPHHLHNLLIGGEAKGAVQLVLLEQFVEGGARHVQTTGHLCDGDVLFQQLLQLFLGHVLGLRPAPTGRQIHPTGHKGRLAPALQKEMAKSQLSSE